LCCIACNTSSLSLDHYIEFIRQETIRSQHVSFGNILDFRSIETLKGLIFDYFGGLHQEVHAEQVFGVLHALHPRVFGSWVELDFDDFIHVY